MQTNNKTTVYKAYLLMRAKMINSFAQADITALSEYSYGVGNRSASDLYNHAVIQYSTLSQADFNNITAQLGTPKIASQTYADLTSAHRDLHGVNLFRKKTSAPRSLRHSIRMPQESTRHNYMPNLIRLFTLARSMASLRISIFMHATPS